MASNRPFDEERISTDDVSPHRERSVEQTTAYVREPHVDEVHSVREDVIIDHITGRRALLLRIENILWFFCSLIAIIMALRIVFLLFEANTANGFVNFVNRFTNPFVRPFDGIFTNPSSGGSVLDTAAVFAMVLIAIITWAVVRLLWLVFDIPESGTSRSVGKYRHDRM
ncbi:MAG: YggT family protein [Thermomicrobiales bacterium]|nr:YggT family protein [Thermomicrobiales bacterium]